MERKDKTKKDNEFDQKLVEVRRVTRVTKGGKRLRFRVCVVIGNKKGKVGMGVSKATDVAIAVNKAINYAKKNLIEAPTFSNTIPCMIYEKYGAAKIMLKPAREGASIISGGAIRTVLELSGIKDVVSKMLGSTSNKISNIRATLNALTRLKKIEDLKISRFEKKKNSSII